MATVSESDAAFYSFLSVMLCLFIVPSLVLIGVRVLRQPARTLRSWGVALHAVSLAIAVLLLLRCLALLQDVDTSGVFDPYEILQVSETSSLREIRKAYRALGRELHPDKNRHNPLAASQFTRVTKAYEALTDPTGMQNYREYGHPDGHQSMLLNFAFLSPFASSNGSAPALFVLGYFGAVFAVIAFVVYKLHHSSGRRDRTQIAKRTHSQLVSALADRMSVHDVVELLLACDEMTATAGGEEAREQAQLRAKAHDKILKKMDAARALPAEILGRIKKHPHPIARENMIALYQFLRRNKLAGVPKPAWIDERLRKVLLELPYLVDIFAGIVAEHSIKRGYSALPLVRTLSLLSSLAQGSLAADADALRDQKERVAQSNEPDVALPVLALASVSLVVADEENVQAGDWLTLSATLTREHVASASGKAPLAATFYDLVDPAIAFRKEHLWLLVLDKATSRLYAAKKLTDLSREVTVSHVFEGPGVAGNVEMEVRVVCPSYLQVETKSVVPLVVARRQ